MSEEAFKVYDFDSDPKWQTYKDNLTFPPNQNSQRLLTKYKKKYYKLHVDPDFVIQDEPTTDQASSPQTEPQPERPQSTQQRSEQPSQQQQQSQPSSNTTWQQRLFTFNAVATNINIIVLVNCVLALLPFFSADLSTFAYRTALLLSCISFGALILRDKNYAISLEVVKNLLQEDYGQYLFVTFMFLISSPPFIPIIFTEAILAAYNLARFAPGYLSAYPVIYDRISPYLTWVTQNGQRIAIMLAYNEFTCLMMMFINLFSSTQRNIILTMVYINFVMIRYVKSYYTQMIFHEIHTKLTGLTAHPSCPQVIRTGYLKFAGFLSNTVSSLQQPRQ